MKTIAWMTLLLAALATSALSQKSRSNDVASDTVSHPFSHSPEALFLAEEEPSFSIGAAAGYLLARAAVESAGCG